jgi:hypothetical protein
MHRRFRCVFWFCEDPGAAVEINAGLETGCKMDF